MQNSLQKRLASAHKFPDRIVIHCFGKTAPGFFVACEPYLTVSQSVSAEELGRNVLQAIEAFRPDFPLPVDWKQSKASYVRDMGAKSHKQLQETSLSCQITSYQGRLEFQPSHNGGMSGDKKGFQPIPKDTISLPADSEPGKIGKTLLQAFGLCTSIYCDT